MSTIATIEPRAAAVPTLASGGRIAAIVPQTMEDAYRLAKAVCMAGMAPKGLDTPEKAMVAILHGMELGLPPMMSLQRIAVVNGRPTLFGDGALALVRASGICQYVKESVEGDGDKRTAWCETQRKGERDSVKRSFSVADAKKASLFGKAGPWQQFPDRMLSMRARGFCLRDVYPDVMGGLYLKEELDDGPTADSDSAPTQAAPQPRRTPPAPPPAPEVIHTQPAQRAVFDFEAYRAALKAAPDTIDAKSAVFDEWVKPNQSAMTVDELEEVQNLLNESCAHLWDDAK